MLKNTKKILLLSIAFIFSASVFAQENNKAAINYVLKLEKMVNRFEDVSKSAKSVKKETKHDYLTKMNAIYEEFVKTKNNSFNHGSGVTELNRLIGLWMEKRMDYIDKLIMELVYNEDYSSYLNTAELDYLEKEYYNGAAGILLEESNGFYKAILNQIVKVKNFYSI